MIEYHKTTKPKFRFQVTSLTCPGLEVTHVKSDYSLKSNELESAAMKCFILFQLLAVQKVSARAAYMASTYCSTPLTAGTVIMVSLIYVA